MFVGIILLWPIISSYPPKGAESLQRSAAALNRLHLTQEQNKEPAMLRILNTLLSEDRMVCPVCNTEIHGTVLGVQDALNEHMRYMHSASPPPRSANGALDLITSAASTSSSANDATEDVAASSAMLLLLGTFLSEDKKVCPVCETEIHGTLVGVQDALYEHMRSTHFAPPSASPSV